MRKIRFFLIALVLGLMWTTTTRAQMTATLGGMTACVVGDSIVIPVDVTNLNAVGAISLKITYNPAVLSFGRTLNWASNFTGIIEGSLTPGALIESWTLTALPVTYGSGKLFDIKFKYLGGTSPVIFSLVPGDNEITDDMGIPFPCTFNPGTVTAGIVATSTITPGGATTFCNGGNVLLSGNTGTGLSYLWKKDGNDILTATSSDYTATTSGSYSLVVTTECGTATSTPIVVTVNDVPSAAGTVTGSANICLGQNGVAFSVPAISGATGYNWTLPAGASIATGSNTESITVDFSTLAVSGIVKVAGTNTCGTGTSSADFSVTANDIPAAAGSITGATTICNTTSGHVYSVGSIGAATSYTWTIPAGATITAGATTNSITLSFDNTVTDFTLKVKGTNDCGSGTESSLAIIVNPTPSVVISNPAGVCSPTTVDLTLAAVTAGSTASLVYGYYTDTTATTIYTTPTNAATGKYFIKGSTTLGCYDIRPVTVSNNPTPNVVINQPAAVCSPSTVNLSTTIDASSTSGLIYTYWTDTTATTSYTTPAGATAGKYFIKGETTQGCFAIHPVVVTVNPTPTVVISNPAGVCSPTTVDLTAAAVTTGSTSGLVYSYYTDTLATTVYTTPTNAATGKYFIKGSTTLGCYDIRPVIVSNNPSPTVLITTPSAVCSPATVNLTAAAVTAGSTSGLIYTYWTDTTATTTYATPTVATAGKYFIKGATTQGCFAIQPVVVTVNNTPTVQITNPSPVCSPNTVNLTLAAVTAGSTTGLIYSYWTNAGATTAYATPTTAGNGTYYIKGATATCFAIQPVNVVVNALPTVTFASMNNDYCVSAAPVTLTGTPAATFATLTCTSNCALPTTCTAGSNSSTYEYITNVSLNGASQTSVGTTYSDYTATQFTQLFKDSTYTLSGTLTTDGPDFLIAYIDWDRDGIFSTSDSIYINNYPGAATGATFTKSITVPSSAVLGDVKMRIMFAYSSIPASCATVSYGEVEDYKINIATKGSNGVFSGVGISGTTFSPATAGVGGWYVGTYTYTNANGCTNTAKDSSMVRALPTIAFTNLNAAYCENGASVTLAATPAGGTFSGTGITGTTFNPTIPSVGTTKVFYTATSAYSCVKTDSQSVIINAKPTVTLTGLAASYCVDGTTSTLSGLPLGGIYAGNGVSGTSFNPTTAGAGNHSILYSYTNTVNGCSNSATSSTTVNALPTLTFASIPAKCIDAAPFALSFATPVGGSYSGLGVSSGNFTPSVAGVGSKYINYSYTDPTTTCTKLDSAMIVINALPTISISGISSPYCLNAINDTLSGTPALGTFTGSGMSANVFQASVAGVGSHYITYGATDVNSCYNKDSVLVTVQALPVVAITNLTSTYCANGIDTTIIATPAGGTFSGTGMVANKFKPSTVAVGPVAITYTYTDGTTNCTNSAVANTNVYAAPVVNLGKDTAACVSYTIDAGTGFTNYLWSTGATTQTLNVTASNTYIAGVVDNHLCYNTDTVVVTINSLPVFSLGNDTIVKLKPYLSLTPGYAPVNLTAPAGMTSYLWSTGATTQSILADTVGLGAGHAGIQTVWVKVTNSNGCQYTDTININFQDNTGISEITKTNFRVYPNPNNGLFTMEVSSVIENAEFKLLDVTGKEIMSEKLDFNAGLTKEFDFRSLSKGVYFVRLINADKVNTVRVVVQ